MTSKVETNTEKRANPFSPHMILLILILFIISSGLSGCAYNSSSIGKAVRDSSLINSDLTRNIGSGLIEKYSGVILDPANLTQKILADAYSQYGLPYKFGGNSPETGFDCSGFVKWSFAQNGIEVPRTTRALMTAGEPVQKENIRPGDILIFRSGRSRTGMHTGIYAGNGVFIHSPHTGDVVKESKVFGKDARRSLVSIRRVVKDPWAAPLPDDLKERIIVQAQAGNTQKKTSVVAKASKNKKSKRSSRAQYTKHYEIKKGDTIWLIAKKFGVSHKQILAANNLPKKHTLKIGQKIAIP